MPFNVSTFNSEISQSGIAHTGFFEARILKAPRIIAPMMRNGMAFRIEAVNLPGRTLTTLDQNYHGPVRRIPYRFTHQPVSFTVILSKDMREREAFMKWQDHFVGHSRTFYNGTMDSPFDSKYYDDAIGEIDIIQYSYPLPGNVGNEIKPKRPNKPGEAATAEQRLKSSPNKQSTGNYVESYNIRLLEAYPSAINDIQMAWGDEGYAKLQVEITYRYAVEAQRTFLNSTQAQTDSKARAWDYLKDLPPGGLE